MKIEGEAKLVTVYVGSSDTLHGQNLATAIVLKAREMGLAGATVQRGIEGFGAASRIHTARILRLSQDLPVKIEIVDRVDRIKEFLPVLDEMVTEGLVTVQDVHVAKYVHDPAPERKKSGS